MMKKILILLILCGAFGVARAQSQYNIFMDSVGTVHTATIKSPQVALSGYFVNLLYKPTTIAGYGITDALSSISLTAGNGISITGSGTTGSPYVIAVVQPTFNFPTRTVNTNFTPNTTKAALVFYSVLCSVTNPALAGSSSVTVTLQYSTNGGTTFQDVAQISNLSSVALAVTVQLTNGQTGELVGIVPINALVRINSVTAGTATVSISKSTEIVY